MKRTFAVFALALSLIGAVPSASFAAPANVFGDEPRLPVTEVSGPSKWIGRLQLPGGGWCTAGLVHKDLILTAGHCMMTPDGKFIPGRYQFQFGYINGRANESSDVTWFWWGGGANFRGSSENDWAIGVLAKPLGSKYGWMGYRALELEDYDLQVVGLTGYSSDFRGGQTAAVQWGCGFRGYQSSGMVRTDCSTSVGASGSPIYRKVTYPGGRTGYEVIGVWVSEYRDGGERSLVGIPYSDAHANMVVPARQFVPTLLRIIAEREKHG